MTISSDKHTHIKIQNNWLRSEYCFDHVYNSFLQYLAERRQSVTESVQGILRTYFTEDYEERKKIHEEELVEFTR